LLMARITDPAIGSTDSIAYMDGNSGNGGGVSGLSADDSLVVKRTRFVLEMTPQFGAPLATQPASPS